MDDPANPGCSATCTEIDGYFCPPIDHTICYPVCGDGVIRGTEECDDDNEDDLDGCDHDCKIEYGWECPTPATIADASVCNTICGDGIVINGVHEIKTASVTDYQEICDDLEADH